MVVLAAIVGGIIQWRQPLLPDSSWLLWIAGRWLDGATLYRDVFEVNPPLAIWLHAPVVWVARISGFPVAALFRIAVLSWCGGCVILFDALLRRGQQPAGRHRVAVVAAAIIVLILPGPFFGQREHLLLAAALPWAALLACRRDGAAVPAAVAGASALVLALGIALKPTHIGLWVALPMVAGRRAWWRFPETWIVPAVGLAYLAIVAGGTAYLGYLSEWGPVYWRYRRVSFLDAAFGNEMALLAVGSCLLVWRFRRQALTLALLSCTSGCLVGAVLQAKALPYHYWPADGLALLLLAIAAPLTRYALLPVAIVWTTRVAQFAWEGGSLMRRQMTDIRTHLGGRHPLTLSRTDDAGWLLVNEAGLPWLSPHYCLWWLQLSGGRPAVPGLPSWAQQDSALRQSLLPASPPDALLLGSDGVDIERWLRQSSQWRQLLDQYEPAGNAAGYRVLYHVAR